MDTHFDGQQEGERILYVVTPHVISKQLAIARIIFLSIFLYLVFWVIGTIVPSAVMMLQLAGFLLAIALLIIGTWWNLTVYKKSKTYITDRRIIRFDVVSPFFMTKRALFWNEALKAKAYSTNLFYRGMNVGIIDVTPRLADGENVQIRDVYYFEDLANYIDKILFTVNNAPSDITTIKSFVPKPRGQRSQN